MSTIQVVEDDIAISQFYRLALTRAGYHVVQAFSCVEALNQYWEVFPDVMLLDLMLPDGDGLSILPHLNIRAEYLNNAVIVVSANADALERVNTAGIQRFFEKPISMNTLLNAIEDSILSTRRSIENAEV